MPEFQRDTRLGPYTHHELRRLIEPRSIAIVGASAREGSFGRSTMSNLANFKGDLFLVNPSGAPIEGRATHKSVLDLPASPDCVLIAVPREAVAGVVDSCAEVSAGGAVIYASGYSETGKPALVDLQRSLATVAINRRLPIIGPNSIGIVNYANGAISSFNPCLPLDSLRPASIGIVSQSGALAHALGQGVARGLSISHVLACGNSCEVDIADCIAYLAADSACRVIACVFEGMKDPRRLLQAAELALAAGKPLLVYKLARGDEGAAAAESHTGSLAGSYASYKAGLERYGVVMVDGMEHLTEMAAFFAKAPAPKGPGVAVVAASGGAAIICADKAEQHGVSLPQPGADAKAVLEQHIPEFGSARNPCDVTAQVVNNPASLAACCEEFAADAAYAAIVLPQVMAYDKATPRNAMLSEIARRHGKIACNVWATEWLEGPGALECELDPGIALFRSADRCFATLAAWRWWHEQRNKPRGASVSRMSKAGLKVAARLDAHTGTAVAETAAKRLFAMYGIPVVEEQLVFTADEAVQASQRIGFPVALKVESVDILHKTDAGVLRLGLQDAAAVHDAFNAVMERANSVRPVAHIAGVIVQPMVPQGLEIMVGAKNDPQFGSMVMVALGGVFVELLKDTQLAIAPVTASEAREMIMRLKGAKALQGFRGSEPVDVNALAAVIAAISQFAADQYERVQELDVNPLICRGASILAVDAVILKRSRDRSAA